MNIYLKALENTEDFKENATFTFQAPNVDEIFPWQVVQDGSATANLSVDNSNPINSVTPYSAKVVASSYSGSSYAGVCFLLSLFFSFF